jgi:LDH2 family malate/lactate/ureidoglycolate dehydrogenase
MDRRVSTARLTELVCAVLGALGLEDRDAALVAERMLFADLRGYPSHGVALLPYYATLIEGGVDPRGRPRVVREQGAALVVDGGNALGHIAASFAMEAAIDRAGELGVGAAAVGGSNHCGAVGAYATIALNRGMIGVATTNALPTMAPWGGAERIVGINPLSIALPAGDGAPFVLDTSFAVAARGRVVLHHQQGQPLPEGWAFDADGQPTTDPAAALGGLLAPIGAAKGVGLALAMGALSTLLSGAAYGTDLGSLEDGPVAGRDGHFVAAIDIAAFVDRGEFEERMQGVLGQLRDSRPAGVEPVRAPGDRGAACERERRADGVPLPAPTRERLVELAERLGVEQAATELA